MNTTKTLRLIALAGLLGSTGFAAPFLAINDNAEVFLTGAVGITSDSNIYLTNEAKSDIITNLDVGAELKFGRASTANGTFSVVDRFNNYADHSGLNENLATVRGLTKYDDGKLKLDAQVNYEERSDNQVDTVNQDFRVRRNVFNANGRAEISITEKSSVAGGAGYSRTDYRRTGYADQDVFSVPLNYYYEISPKVDLSLGYRYRDTGVSLGLDSRDDFYNVGARGQFTPKFSGEFSVGLNRRRLESGNADSQLGIESKFTFAYSPKTSFDFGVTNDFGTTGQGQQQKSLTFSGSVQNNVSEELRVGLGVNHRTIEYATKTDHFLEGQINVTYQVNAVVSLRGAYAHRENQSPLTGAAFKGDVFSLSASFRY